jgi:RimJ/RimL family protein N-acetyltransferase
MGLDSFGRDRHAPVRPPDPLTDGAVTVRLREERDIDAIAAASHDAETVRWLDDPPMDAEARRTSLDRIEELWRSGRATPLVIADAVTDEAVGIVNLQFREGEGEVATVAYSVFPSYRGRGIAPRALRLLAQWALHEVGVGQLLLEADEANVASIRVAQKCGFERIGSRTERGPDGGDRTQLVFACST